MPVSLARLLARKRSIVAAVALAAFVPAAAWAGQFQKDSAIDAKVKDLTPVQRQALDIIGIDVTKTRYVAKIIVRFKGDFQRHMRDRKFVASGALVRLSFNGPGAAGAKGMTITSVGAGKQMKTVVGPGKGGPLAAVRDGRELTFWVGGIDAYGLDTVEARSFQGPPAHGAADTAVMEVTPNDYKLVSDCDRIQKIANILGDQVHVLGVESPANTKARAEARKQRKALKRLSARSKKFLDAAPCKGNQSTG
jgi:hypothetical protein